MGMADTKPWFSFYTEHYRRKTAHLSMAQDGAYRRLLDHYYESENPLPPDLNSVHRIARCENNDERRCVSLVLNEFFHLEADGWHNDRADEEIAQRAIIIGKKRFAGKLGGEASRGKSGRQRNSERIADATACAPPDGAAHGQADGSANEQQSEWQKNTHLHLHKHTQKEEGLESRSERGGTGESNAPPAPHAKRKKPHVSIPDNFPGEVQKNFAIRFWGEKQRLDLVHSVGDEMDQFRDRALREDQTQADWPATWRTWVRNALTMRRSANGGRERISNHDRGTLGAALYLAEHEADGDAEGIGGGARTAGGGVPSRGNDHGQVEGSARTVLRGLAPPDVGGDS